MIIYDYILQFDTVQYILKALAPIELPHVNADIKNEGGLCAKEVSPRITCKNEDGDEVNCPCCLSREGSGSNGESRFSQIMKGLFATTNNSDMAPPFYSDLGKKTGDIFNKGYHFGVMKVDLKTKSEAGVEFASGLTSTAGKVFGNLQSKYTIQDMGITLIEKWNTDNILGAEISMAEKLAPGVKVTLEGVFAPQTGNKSGMLKTSFVNDMIAANAGVNLDMAGPLVDASCVVHYEGWLAGVMAQFDSQKTKFTKNNFSLGYQTPEFMVHTNVDNGSDFCGSVYQKVNEQIECGVIMKWSIGANETLFGVGAKYHLDPDSCLHAKVNNQQIAGFGFTTKLRPGVSLTLSACIDGLNLNAGGHKAGLSLELEPGQQN